MTFYATVTRSQHPEMPGAWLVGYVEIRDVADSDEARDLMFKVFGNKWSFLYSSLDDVHPLDRHLWRVISPEKETDLV